jgi:hypothetical protein
MNERDTSFKTEQRYRQMMMTRSSPDRMMMGDSLYATARSLALAHMKDTSPGALRKAIFMKFYGHEFDRATRERILARLGAE